MNDAFNDEERSQAPLLADATRARMFLTGVGDDVMRFIRSVRTFQFHYFSDSTYIKQSSTK